MLALVRRQTSACKQVAYDRKGEPDTTVGCEVARARSLTEIAVPTRDGANFRFAPKAPLPDAGPHPCRARLYPDVCRESQ